MKSDREFDIVVLGATGYVGRRLVTELEKLAKSNGWRLLATTRSAQKSANLGREHASVSFDTMDVASAIDVDRITRRAKLVINCIGPFDLHGENVISACARLGTHYLDITGEILFARRMIDRYHELAKKNGAMIVPFAGFDSVPSDIGVYLMGREMEKLHSQPVASVDLIFKMKGGINGGTAASALDMGAKLKQRDQKNYNFLAPQEPERSFEEMYHPRFIVYLRKWVAPFFMEPINNKVIFRSLALAPTSRMQFTSDFRYRECIDIPGGLVGAMATAWSLGGGHLMLKTSAGRSVASLVFPKPGTGPSEKQMKEGFFEATFIATGARGKVLVHKMLSEGDPGNISTVKMLLACTRALFSDGFDPPRGLLTPATAFGIHLLPALRKSGVSWT
jgi:short subunit dehydrogenase-like uncharacterized protein